MRRIINSLNFPSLPGRMTDYSDRSIIDTPPSCEVWIGAHETSQHALNGQAMADHCNCIRNAGHITRHWGLFRRPTEVTGTHAVRKVSQGLQEVFGSRVIWLFPILGLRDVHVFQRVDLHVSNMTYSLEIFTSQIAGVFMWLSMVPVEINFPRLWTFYNSENHARRHRLQRKAARQSKVKSNFGNWRDKTTVVFVLGYEN